MANNTKEIKRRIKAVKNIGQITKAQQMVSAVKMKKAQNTLHDSNNYFYMMEELLNHLLIDGEQEIREMLNKRKSTKEKNIAVVLISASRGLAGALNANLTKKSFEFIENMSKNNSYNNNEFVVFDDTQESHESKKVDIKLLTVEKKAKSINAALQREIIADFSSIPTPAKFEDTTPISSVIFDKFKKEEINEVYVIYTHFITTFTQKAVIKKLLPFDFEKAVKKLKEKTNYKKNWYAYSTPIEEFFNEFLPIYIDTVIYQSVLDAAASEHSARMIAMKSATDNAKELKDELTFEYNQKRQANITQEIAEITSAAESI